MLLYEPLEAVELGIGLRRSHAHPKCPALLELIRMRAFPSQCYPAFRPPSRLAVPEQVTLT